MKRKNQQPPQSSHTENFLKGQKVPFSDSPIRQVLKTGPEKRRIVFMNGKTHDISKKQLFQVFSASLAVKQAEDAWANRVQRKNGKVSMKVGGLLKGVERSYNSVQGARKALQRRYGVDPAKNTIVRQPVASQVGRYQKQRDSLRGEAIAAKPEPKITSNSARKRAVERVY